MLHILMMKSAYVSGEKQGLILETPYKMGDTLNGTSGLDIYGENKLMEHTLEQLTAQNCSQDTIKSAMKDLGIQRFFLTVFILDKTHSNNSSIN